MPYLLQDRIMQEYLVIDDTDNTLYSLTDNLVQVVEWGSSEWIEIDFDKTLSDAIIYIENFGIPVVNIEFYANGELCKKESFWQFDYIDTYVNTDEIVDKVIIYCQDLYDSGSEINVYVAENASLTEKTLYEKRSNESFENINFMNDKITAEITLFNESYVFTQIPYDSGWHIYSDGEEVSVIKADGGFCAFYLPEGRHKICFEYQAPWLKMGMVISICSFGLLLLWYFTEKEKVK